MEEIITLISCIAPIIEKQKQLQISDVTIKQKIRV